MTLIACYLCVCVFTSIDYNVRVFLFPSVQQVQTSVTRVCLPRWQVGLRQVGKTLCVCTVFLCCFGRPELAEGLTDKKNNPPSINLLSTLKRIMWLISLVRHQVNHTFWPVFYGCVYESVALSNTTEHCTNLWFKLMDFMPRCQGTGVQPQQAFILKTMEQWMHVVDLTLFE